MFCPNCGNSVLEGSQVCGECSFPLQVKVPGTGKPLTSGKAIRSVVSGIFGLFRLPVSILAAVLGYVPRS
jgi:hypothetical protein